jgi:hypothetical protein
VFISRSSLWTDLNCKDGDKTCVYLERSKSLPVNLTLDTNGHLPLYHPLSDTIPHVIERLGSLTVVTMPEELQDITDHLSRPAPLLEKLFIRGVSNYGSRRSPVLTPTLFDGDLSSLRKLRLDCVRTELPWRNMVNLTSFKLARTLPGEVTVKQLLDFFENTPRLRKVIIYSVTLAPGAQNGRLVPLVCLETMEIMGSGSASLLLDHLLIPVGARLMVGVDLPSLLIKDHPPRFLDNLRNLANFTTVTLSGCDSNPYMQFSGPNGQFSMITTTSGVDRTCLMIESLDHFDTSGIEQLTITHGKIPSNDPPYRALLPMKHLRTLTLRCCESSHVFVRALHPKASSSRVVACPELEELVIVLDGMTVDMSSVIGVVAARASRRLKLKSIRIVGPKSVRPYLLEQLGKHVLHVEYVPWSDGAGDGINDKD